MHAYMYVCVRLYVYFISKASVQISIKFGTGNMVYTKIAEKISFGLQRPYIIPDLHEW
jgi:hypothetical protein